MSALLDAIATIGAVFDTPGAIVRNTLAGENPFLGLFDPEERTYGRDLLETWGLLDANEEGLDFGDVAGFGVDVISDPLTLLGFGKAAGGLGRMAARYADDAVKAPTLGVFGGALGDFSKYGKQAKQLSPDDAMQLYKGWADNLTPEEAEAMRLFTSGPQEAISSTLRGTNPSRPLSDLTASLNSTAPNINSIERVMNEVVPYADSAIAKTAGVLPGDVVTYRLGEQIGDLTKANARSKIGDVISDPSYMSTTVTPYGRFYGNADRPTKSMLLDILYPEGTPGAFPNAGKLSSYPNELELLAPRDLPMRVMDVQDVPAVKVGYDYFKLTPDGKPIPLHNNNAGEGVLFDPDALYDLSDWSGKPLYPAGTFDTPPNLDEILVPGWEDVIAKSPKENFTNVLLEAMPEGLPQVSSPATRRLTNDEILEVVNPLFENAKESLVSRGWEDAGSLNSLLEGTQSGRYPISTLLNRIDRAKIAPSITDLVRQSVPENRAIPAMIEILRKAGVPVAGVSGATAPLLQELLSREAA